MAHKTFLEVMMGSSSDLNLSRSQKRVLLKASMAQDDPRLAAEYVINSEDSRNLIASSKLLARYGYITTDPPELGPEDEPITIEITDKGQEAIETNDIANDESLLTDKEKEESAPEGGDINADTEVAPEVPPENPEPNTARGQNVELELSSFFQVIDDLADLKT